MFQNLTNLKHQRTVQEAVGFYIAYILVIILCGGILGAIGGMMNPNDAANVGLKFGIAGAVVASVALSLQILRAKKLTNNYLYMSLVVISGVAAFLLGGFVSLIIPAYFSTLKAKGETRKRK